MNLTPYLAPAGGFLLGAVVATIVAWVYVDRVRRTVLAKAATRHKQDLDEAHRTWAAVVAVVEHDRDEATNGWQAAYDKGLNLQQQLADEQRRLDAADRDRAALRGQVADLRATVEDYARAHLEVPRAWRAHVNDLDEEAKDNVYGPPLEPSPVLVGLVADAVAGRAPGLPDEWEPESFTQWIKKYPMPAERTPTPVPSVRGVRSKRKPSDTRRAVGR